MRLNPRLILMVPAFVTAGLAVAAGLTGPASGVLQVWLGAGPPPYEQPEEKSDDPRDPKGHQDYPAPWARRDGLCGARAAAAVQSRGQSSAVRSKPPGRPAGSDPARDHVNGTGCPLRC